MYNNHHLGSIFVTGLTGNMSGFHAEVMYPNEEAKALAEASIATVNLGLRTAVINGAYRVLTSKLHLTLPEGFDNTSFTYPPLGAQILSGEVVKVMNMLRMPLPFPVEARSTKGNHLKENIPFMLATLSYRHRIFMSGRRGEASYELITLTAEDVTPRKHSFETEEEMIRAISEISATHALLLYSDKTISYTDPELDRDNEEFLTSIFPSNAWLRSKEMEFGLNRFTKAPEEPTKVQTVFEVADAQMRALAKMAVGNLLSANMPGGNGVIPDPIVMEWIKQVLDTGLMTPAELGMGDLKLINDNGRWYLGTAL